ncbi:lamin tail domain-containing protein [Candidatus Parcubacteria bacterium]|nr:lamin tail domain-containing protein [Candidatus Parcubacteria bacterium]
MEKTLKFFLLIIIALIGFQTDFILAVENSVVINEIAWMGTKNSHNDEWIELYNNSYTNVNLDEWILKANDKSPEIKLSGFILSKGFYLLERTDDDSVNEVSADIIYKGALNNKGEILELFDSNDNLIDKLDCHEAWFAGDNQSKQTMERKNSNWQTSQEPGGTPRRENSDGKSDDEEANYEDDNEAKHLMDVPPRNNYPSGIVINEVLPSPEGPDAENEWIEIFNKNNFDVDISKWKISDTIGKVKEYIFPIGTKISGKGFLVLERPETKITLNNNSDGLKIFNPNKEIVDEVSFEKAILGQSYNKFEFNWQWSENLTPGSINVLSSLKEKYTETRSLLSERATESGSLSDDSIEASISQGFKGFYENSSRRMAIVIALIISFYSAVIILILKKNLKSN